MFGGAGAVEGQERKKGEGAYFLLFPASWEIEVSRWVMAWPPFSSLGSAYVLPLPTLPCISSDCPSLLSSLYDSSREVYGWEGCDLESVFPIGTCLCECIYSLCYRPSVKSVAPYILIIIFQKHLAKHAVLARMWGESLWHCLWRDLFLSLRKGCGWRRMYFLTHPNFRIFLTGRFHDICCDTAVHNSKILTTTWITVNRG